MNILGSGLALLAVVGCAVGETDVAHDEMRGMIEKMEEGQKAHDRKLRDWSISYMSLPRMFPDENLRALARAAGRGRVGGSTSWSRQASTSGHVRDGGRPHRRLHAGPSGPGEWRDVDRRVIDRIRVLVGR